MAFTASLLIKGNYVINNSASSLRSKLADADMPDILQELLYQ